MADLVSVQEGLPIRISGISSTSGIPDNYADVLSTGQLKVAVSDASGNALNSTSNALNVYLTNTTIAVTQSSGPWTINLTEIGGSALALGQTTMSASIPVTIASNQSALAVYQSGTWTVQQGTPPWTIQGDSASGATAAGNPVQIGGVFNTTQPTITTGQTVAAQMTDRGAQIVATGVDAFNIDNITGTVSLPTGASTATNQATEITSLQLIDNPIGPVSPGTPGTGSELIGGIYNTTLPTFTNGEQGAIQLDSSGRQLVSQPTASALNAQVVGPVASGVANSGNPVKSGNVYNSSLPTPTTGEIIDSQANQFGEHAVQFRNKYHNITTSGTTTVKSGSGRLHGISFAQNSGITVTIYDNTAASGTIIATFESQNMTFIGPLGCEFSTGLTINQSGSNNITVYYY